MEKIYASINFYLSLLCLFTSKQQNLTFKNNYIVTVVSIERIFTNKKYI